MDFSTFLKFHRDFANVALNCNTCKVKQAGHSKSLHNHHLIWILMFHKHFSITCKICMQCGEHFSTQKVLDLNLTMDCDLFLVWQFVWHQQTTFVSSINSLIELCGKLKMLLRWLKFTVFVVHCYVSCITSHLNNGHKISIICLQLSVFSHLIRKLLHASYYSLNIHCILDCEKASNVKVLQHSVLCTMFWLKCSI